MSKIEKMILSRDLDYLQPYFYTNPYALRCELGMGDTREEYMREARRRAREIHRILFPHGADAILFNYWITDWSDSGEAGEKTCSDPDGAIERTVREEARALRFLSECMMRYRHVSVKDLKLYDHMRDPDAGVLRRDRVVCYADGRGFDDGLIIEGQIASEDNSEVSLVSFENECILSVYDDRGCDVVFADHDALRAFYAALKPYFLPYDMEEMEKRYLGAGPADANI